MNIEGFKQFCKKRDLYKDNLNEALKIVKDFNDFLIESERTIDIAREQDVHAFAQKLIDKNKSKLETFYPLISYSHFSGNNEMLVALYELIDGSEVLNNLSKALFSAVGKKQTEDLLRGIDFPKVGTPSSKKPIITKQVIERLVEALDEKTCHKVLISNLHGMPKEFYKRRRENFLKAKNIDEYLKQRHADFIKTLEKHRDEKTLFFTQEIDDNVIEHVKNNPRIEGGVREGKIVYVEKIPYMTKKFLTEKDENLKKYYYCHCPWVREALKTGEIKIPSKFCDCSAGYYKTQWEVILDQPVEVETIETILEDDSRCLFAIFLPKEIVQESEKNN
jgi:hypothetical protein